MRNECEQQSEGERSELADGKGLKQLLRWAGAGWQQRVLREGRGDQVDRRRWLRVRIAVAAKRPDESGVLYVIARNQTTSVDNEAWHKTA